MSKIKRTCPRCSGDLTQSPAGDIAQLECTKCRSIFRLKEGSSIALGSDEKSSSEKSTSTTQKFNSETQAASLGSDEKSGASNAEETLKSNQDTAAKSQALTTDKPAQTESKPSNTTVPANEKSIGMLGRFELREVLGQGAFGRVFRAYDPQIDRMVALKVPIFGEDEQKKAQRFQAEAKSAGRLRHPNIVPTFETGRVGKNFYIASQFIEGATIAARIKSFESDPISFEQSAEWAKSIASALAYAHEMGIIHRDVKPQNIMLDKRNEPQLMDFGLAKRLNEDSAATTEGSLLGTPAYMSPEQARGEVGKVGAHSDQYAIGAILYELLTGQRPFDGPPHAVLAQVIGAEPKNPRSVRPEVPRDLEAIALKAMSKESSKRYASCEALAEDLSNWLRGEAISARPPSTFEKLGRWAKRNKQVAALVVGMVTVVTTALISISIALLYMNDARKEAADNFLKADEQAKLAKEAEKKATDTAAHLQLVLEEVTREKNRADEKAAEAEKRRVEAEQRRVEVEQQRSEAETQKRIAQEKTEVAIVESRRAEEEARKSKASATREAIASYLPDIIAAKSNYDAKNFARTREILNSTWEESRNWEWRYLNNLVTPSSCMPLDSIAKNPVGWDFSPNSELFWMITNDGTFFCVNLANAVVHEYKNFVSELKSPAIIHSIQTCASTEEKIWVVFSCENEGVQTSIVSYISLRGGKPTTLASRSFNFSMSNSHLLIAGANSLEIRGATQGSRTSLIFSSNEIQDELESNRPFKELDELFASKQLRMICSCGAHIFLEDAAKNVFIYESSTQSLVSTPIRGLQELFTSKSVDRLLFRTEARDGIFTVDLRNQSYQQFPLSEKQPICALSDNGEVFAASEATAVRLYEGKDLKNSFAIDNLSVPVTKLKISPNGRWLLTSGLPQQEFLLHDLSIAVRKDAKISRNAKDLKVTGTVISGAIRQTDPLTAVFLTDENMLYQVDGNGIIKRIGNLKRTHVPVGVSEDGSVITAMDAATASIHVLSSEDLSTITTIDVAGSAKPKVINDWSNLKNSRAEYAKQNMAWATNGGDSIISIIQTIDDSYLFTRYSPTGEIQHRVSFSTQEPPFSWISSSGLYVAIDAKRPIRPEEDFAKAISLADIDSECVLSRSPRSLKVVGLRSVLYADGKNVKHIDFTNQDSPKRREFPGYSDDVTDVVLTTDAKRLFTGSRDGTVRLWDSATGNEIMMLRKFGSPVGALDLSDDGYILVAISESGEISTFNSVIPHAIKLLEGKQPGKK